MATDPSAARTILIVDDELPVRHALAAALEGAGYTVIQAARTKRIPRASAMSST